MPSPISSCHGPSCCSATSLSFRERLASLADEHDALQASQDALKRELDALSTRNIVWDSHGSKGTMQVPAPLSPLGPASPDFDEAIFTSMLHNTRSPTTCESQPVDVDAHVPPPAQISARRCSHGRRASFETTSQKTRKGADTIAKCTRSFQRLGLIEQEEGPSNASDFVTNVEDIELDKKISHLWKVFQELDTQGLGVLTAEDLHKFDRMSRKSDAEVNGRLKAFEEAIEGFNHFRHSDDETADMKAVAFTTFAEMMFLPNLEAELGSELAQNIFTIREMFTLANAMDQIAVSTNLSIFEITEQVNNGSKFLRSWDSICGMVILVNAAVIGVSTDISPEWAGWIWFEVFFTTFFVMELVFKLRLDGCRRYFLGAEWHWNMFDAIVVVAALLDLISSLPGLGLSADLKNLTLVRLMRLARITRVLRLLRIRAFRELTLIVNGVIAGMRTLLWAMILLMTVVYVLGVLLAQTVGDDSESLCGTLDPTPYCLQAAKRLNDERAQLFSDVKRSMFTVFRCFMNECTAADGTPIMPALLDTYGWPIAIAYVLCILFVCFGLFNLIMANFVESTMEAAKHDDQKRYQLRHTEHIRVAHRLQKLMLKLCSSNPADLLQAEDMTVHRDVFDEFLGSSEVDDLLDDLDVTKANRKDLFEILDADGNGSLSVRELIAGLMKIRGPSDKSDAVASLLGVRAVHQTLRTFEQLVLENLKGIWNALSEMEHRIKVGV